jgi:hypothetical protein
MGEVAVEADKIINFEQSIELNVKFICAALSAFHSRFFASRSSSQKELRSSRAASDSALKILVKVSNLDKDKTRTKNHIGN